MRVLKFTILYIAVVLPLLFSNAAFSVVTEDGAEDGAAWYSDVEARDTYHEAIYYMSQKGYVEGYEDGTFLPFQEVNRAEALKIILSVSLAENDPNSTGAMNFPDVETDDWFFDYVEEGFEKNLISGHDDGYFRPEDPINRAEAMKMLSKSQAVMFTAELSDNWYDNYMGYGAENALIIPVEGEDGAWDYLPGENLTRGELCEIIYRLMKDKYTGEVEYGVGTYYGYDFDGVNTASGTSLNAHGYMAAHKTLPFGTWVRVTNLDTMLSVNVEIVDRGPYGEGRIIDLTPHAFDQIGSLSTGVLRTRVEVLK